MASEREDFVVEQCHFAAIADIVNTIPRMYDEWMRIMGSLLARTKNAAVRDQINRLLKQTSIYEAVDLTLTQWIADEGKQALFNSLLSTILPKNRNLRDKLYEARKKIQRAGEARGPRQDADLQPQGLNQDTDFQRATPRHNSNARSRLSEMDPTRRIDDSTWVVSLARNSRAQHNNQHVFIILEGMDEGKPKTYFMDFRAERELDLIRPGFHPGIIRFHPLDTSRTDSFVYSCPLKLMRLVKGQHTSYSCNLDRGLCENLVEKVERASLAVEQPRYNILGNKSVFAKFSALLLSSEVGHSCLSWAYQQLEELDDPGLNHTLHQALDVLRFIIGVPSTAMPAYQWLRNPYTVLIVFVLALGISAIFPRWS